MLNLPIGDVNVLVLTDVHSWVAGHSTHEPYLNVNYGDVISFYETLQKKFDDKGKDLFFVMNGDFIDGTGLTTYPPSELVSILERMPWDAINIGNHELYKRSTIEYISQKGGFIDHWNGRYITSNVVWAKDDNKPLGSRYMILKGKHTKSTILTFGFLFNFTNNDPIATVQPVQEVVTSDWFVNVLTNNSNSLDAILVLAHMDVHDTLVDVIRLAIRSYCGTDIPIQFITGHTHYRGYTALDDMSTSFEAGRYLDTIGYVSFPSIETKRNGRGNNINNDNKTSLFHHRFLGANIDVLKETLGLKKSDTFATQNGIDMTAFIQQTEESMGILNVLGCSPRTYHLEDGLQKPTSLWRLYAEDVIVRHYFQYDPKKVYVQSCTAFRYDLFEGENTVSDIVSVSPFNDTVYMITPPVNGSVLFELLADSRNYAGSSNPFFPNIPMNNAPYLQELPSKIIANVDPNDIKVNMYYSLYVVHFDLPSILEKLVKITGDNTTKANIQYSTATATATASTTSDSIPTFDSSRKNTSRKIITTTGLWMNFIKQYWPCKRESASQRVPYLVMNNKDTTVSFSYPFRRLSHNGIVSLLLPVPTVVLMMLSLVFLTNLIIRRVTNKMESQKNNNSNQSKDKILNIDEDITTYDSI